jgi:hypothetical protein
VLQLVLLKFFFPRYTDFRDGSLEGHEREEKRGEENMLANDKRREEGQNRVKGWEWNTNRGQAKL